MKPEKPVFTIKGKWIYKHRKKYRKSLYSVFETGLLNEGYEIAETEIYAKADKLLEQFGI